MTDLRGLMAKAGSNDVVWEDPALPGRPITLRSARPRRFSAHTPVLFVHHGVLRNGDDYRDFWLPLVDEADLLVVAPEFSNDSFPGAEFYNFGNRIGADGAENPRAEWTYGVDGRVFALLQSHGVTQRSHYGVWGHSAGGQFVHRMMSLGFRDHVAAAVTANAGTYAMPDLAEPWPFGLAGTGLDHVALGALLRFRLTVMAGTNDIDATSAHFPKEPPAMRQGGTRYERAHRFIGEARKALPDCAWTIVDVAGVGHDGEAMSAAAAPILSAALHAA